MRLGHLAWLLLILAGWWFPRVACSQDQSSGSTNRPAGQSSHESAQSQADELWEYSPYRVRVWFAVEPVPALTERWKQELQTHFQHRAEMEAPATWILTSREAPLGFRSEMLHHLDRMQFESLLARQPDAVDDRRISKLLLVSIRQDVDHYLVQVREVDCRTRLLGNVFEQPVGQVRAIASAAFQLALTSFSPIAEVVRAKGSEAQLRLRAGGLVVQPYDPARLDAGSFLLPVVRNNDRYGNPREGGILVPPWTFLQVLERERGDLTCRVHSGLSNPVGGRSSARKERLCLGVKPAGESTRLLVQTRTEPPRPLAGFDIYSKNPLDDQSELIGRTNWRGEFDVSQDGQLMRIIYVRSGDALLARLPIVPGLYDQLTADTVDDSIRLRTEGFIKNVQSELMDLVARRLLTAKRMQKKLEEGQIDEAQKLFDQYKQLPNDKTLAARIRANKAVTADADDRTRRRINRMYTDLEQLIAKFLNSQQQDQLAQALADARAKR